MKEVTDRICYIFGAGQRQIPQIELETDDLVIAADGGFDYLDEIGLRADIVLGDFDSVISYDLPSDSIRYPREKDDTDMMIAAKLGLDRGYVNFRIYGGLGGRLDHTLANIQLLTYLTDNGASGVLYEPTQAVTVIKNSSYVFAKAESCNTIGNICSVFSLDHTSHNVTIRGFKYEIEGVDMKNHIPIGVSNEFTGKRSVISVGSGTLAIIWQLESQ